eukprot:TRINITY_DN11549_c0_g1_i1.p1 TRINITY_DN11549_c0_g1~~TRINITY_DN11549_c0_g1_i1.p1  ORF type:complete len:393 (-),score=88.69 TRINITY_DN11549_c0_g1_i1:270-1310(-)
MRTAIVVAIKKAFNYDGLLVLDKRNTESFQATGKHESAKEAPQHQEEEDIIEEDEIADYPSECDDSAKYDSTIYQTDTISKSQQDSPPPDVMGLSGFDYFGTFPTDFDATQSLDADVGDAQLLKESSASNNEITMDGSASPADKIISSGPTQQTLTFEKPGALRNKASANQMHAEEHGFTFDNNFSPIPTKSEKSFGFEQYSTNKPSTPRPVRNQPFTFNRPATHAMKQPTETVQKQATPVVKEAFPHLGSIQNRHDSNKPEPARWEWQGNSGDFKPYPSAINNKLEEHFQAWKDPHNKRHPIITFEISKTTYYIDFSARLPTFQFFYQIAANDTRRRRRVQRVAK